jgi:uncharacterized repeat protein (TIGR01451 family)
MNNILRFVKNILPALFIIPLFGIFCLAQSKVDLEVTAQAASETARGGEMFSYTVTVKNIGSAKASEVILMQDGNSEETSAVSSAGTCALLEESQQLPKPFRCMLGDIEQGESVIINFSIKFRDFGGEEEDGNVRVPMMLPSLERRELSEEEKANLSKTTVADINVSAEENENDRDNNRTEIKAELLSSKNKAPHVQIISPKSDEAIPRQVNKPFEVTLTIKAFDSDGKIEKVIVHDPAYERKYDWTTVFEDDQYKYLYEGKKFTRKEFEEYLEASKPPERLATKTGANTYTYALKNSRFRENVISITAVDDGGRMDFTSTIFIVEGDAKVEIVTPKNEQVFAPDATITIETSSKINDAALNNLRIMATRNDYISPEWSDYPLLELISKTGNTFRNRYILKNLPEGNYNLKAILFNDKNPTNFSESVRIIIAEPRVIKITSFKNGQKFEQDKPIMLRVEAIDIKGNMIHDNLALMIDDKQYGEISNSWTNELTPPYKKIIDPKIEFNILDKISLEKGFHKIQIIAKENDIGLNTKAILGKSEIITINVK